MATRRKAAPANPAHFYNPQTPIYQLSRTELRFDKLIRTVPKPDGWDVQITRTGAGWAAEAQSTRLGKSYSSKRKDTANHALQDLREVLANHEVTGVSI